NIVPACDQCNRKKKANREGVEFVADLFYPNLPVMRAFYERLFWMREFKAMFPERMSKPRFMFLGTETDHAPWGGEPSNVTLRSVASRFLNSVQMDQLDDVFAAMSDAA